MSKREFRIGLSPLTERVFAGNVGSGDTIVAAFAEPASGPGWSNAPVWVIVRDDSGKLRQECLQPDEQSSEMAALYRVSAAAHEAMTSAARRSVKGGAK